MFKYLVYFSKSSYYMNLNYFVSLNKELLDNYLNKFFLVKNYIILKNYNIFFSKKEYTYTKLKYSRVPQFDMASGIIASLLSGLLGFLVTEKFGFELIDSGDFYTLVMYLIFILLIIRILFKSFTDFLIITVKTKNPFKNFILFYKIILNLLIKFFWYKGW